MAASALTIEKVVFERLPFKIAAKRYTDGSCRSDGVTLGLMHGTGFRSYNYLLVVYRRYLLYYLYLDKDSWGPTLEKLMVLQSNAHGDRTIREAWSFDAPSHGDSAVLNNAETLNIEWTIFVSHGKFIYVLKFLLCSLAVSEIGGAIVSLVNSQYLMGHRIIVIGHSPGSSAT